MKKILALLLLVSGTLCAQNVVSISGPSTVEVGIPYTYNLQFTPCYPCGMGSGTITPDSYRITEWIVTTTSNQSGATASGYIGVPTNQTTYFNNGTSPGANPYSIPIQWGDGSSSGSDIITVKVSGIYIDSSTGAFTGYFNYVTTTKDITVNRLTAPIITGTTSINDCNQTNVTFGISNFTNASSYQWSVSPAGAIVGSSTGPTVTITPPATGNFTVSCTLRRVGSGANYNVVGYKGVVRTSRSLVMSTVPTTATYICRGSGLVCNVANNADITGVVWHADNSVISAESIVGSTRQVTITPNASTVPGTILTIYATATYAGGCTATTPSKNYPVYLSGTPPIPSGSIEVDDFVCNQDTPILMHFIPSPSFTNGVITMTPASIAHPFQQRNFNVTVKYTNPCSGSSSTKVYAMSTPGPCAARTANVANDPSVKNRVAESADGKVTIYPNPATDSFKVSLPARQSGTYKLVDSYNIIIQERKFNNTDELDIKIEGKIKPGLYFIQIAGDQKNYSEKILLN
jgi:hypothetical protein